MPQLKPPQLVIPAKIITFTTQLRLIQAILKTKNVRYVHLAKLFYDKITQS